MIQLTDFNTSLTYKDNKGNTRTVSFMDPEFGTINSNFNAQNAANGDNAHNLNMYMDALKKYNESILDGRTPEGPVPIKPKLIVVTDMGVTSEVDYNPPLPDPAHLVASPTVNAIVTPNTPMVLDPYQTAMMNAILGMGRMLADLQAALKTKGVI